MWHSKIDPDATLYEIAHDGIVDDKHHGSGAIVQAKRYIFTKMAARPPREFAFNANNPDARTLPLCRGGQVEKIAQKLVPQVATRKRIATRY